MENFLSTIIWDVPAVSPGQCRVMIPNELRKAWVQAEELGLDHCISNSSWALRWAKASCAAVAAQGTWKHQYSALVGTERSVCCTLCHSFTVLSGHLLLSMVALPARGRCRFPSPSHTKLLALLSSLLSEPLCLSRHADDSGQFWGREAGECLCCGHGEQDLQQDKCQI